MSPFAWPAYSQDMNCIENIWAILKRKVHEAPTTTREADRPRAANLDNRPRVGTGLSEGVPNNAQTSGSFGELSRRIYSPSDRPVLLFVEGSAPLL